MKTVAGDRNCLFRVFNSSQDNVQLRTKSYGIDRHAAVNCRKQIFIVHGVHIQCKCGLKESMVEFPMEAVTKDGNCLFRGLRILLDNEVQYNTFRGKAL
jgi:hypothetical protein